MEENKREHVRVGWQRNTLEDYTVQQARASQTKNPFMTIQPAFKEIVGFAKESDWPGLTLLHEKSYAFAHEAGVYDDATKSVYFTANWQSSRDPLKIHSVHTETLKLTEQNFDKVINANGACMLGHAILFCAQGDMEHNGGLVLVVPSTGEQVVLLDHFHGKPFNSLNDVVIEHPTGCIWFTDPDYAYAQGFRPRPQLPNHVYRYDLTTQACSVVEADLKKPNGLCFSHDYKHMYITDTGAIAAHEKPGEVYYDETGPSTIYKYDVINGTLHNKRTFAYIANGVPDGIKCDTKGNVYTGCGDGIQVFEPERGTLIGKILVPGGVANFNFARGRIWIYNETKLWVADVAARGCLEQIECSSS
ncbi:hypothetical protein BCR37DRAFT_382619 [Protomyces lactucae-debilis]|uniref:SMP-30/Gluconolactonase/LRE-like region domain-containing protein n=1 Tax=Protomyces lactucae-debilis TaxID=2754530 RepID=A0A1Y2F1K8_PROLT|nr:uncharacterized protein BCR37DRAFT_382619 [Protomyces lactucae-debilis]ORY77723.1 hypothetical protein BCR37DRAFT_382619 [Protomyces lactucae-debilis]